MPIAPALRRRLKNPVTARVYQGALDLLRRAAIWHDLLLARCARRAVPAVSVRRRPSAAVDTDRIAVFVIHAETLDASHRRAMHALAAAGYCVALVNNQAFNLEDVPPEAAFVIENHNIGRDIGAYIRTLRCLQAEGVLPSLGRVLFLNDSVVYLPGVEAVLAALAEAPEDWAGLTANTQDRFHISSWCFQLSTAVINGPTFRRWAARFRFIANRAYLIRAGEMRLSRMLLTAGFQPRVLFDDCFWLSLCGRIDASENVLAAILPRNLVELHPKGRDNARFLRLTNQTHLFTFPGIAFGVFPFVKKDLYYRHVFSLEHVELLCAEIACRYGESVAAECRRALFDEYRGCGSDLRRRLGIG